MTPPADPFSKPLLRTVIMTGVPALGAGLAAWAASVEAVSIEIVGSARTADEAANLAGLHAVDLVIVCADLEPQRVLDRMRLRLPETAVLVLVGAEDQEAEARAFRAGASAAIPSSATEETFGCALRSLAHGRATLSIQVLRTLATPRDDAELTQRQRQIRELLDQGLKAREIGEILCISTNTVKTHIARLRDRLQRQESGLAGLAGAASERRLKLAEPIRDGSARGRHAVTGEGSG